MQHLFQHARLLQKFLAHQAFMIYLMMLAVITPALISGAFAERMRFSAYLVEKTMGLRVAEEEEVMGLDISSHGEAGYNS